MLRREKNQVKRQIRLLNVRRRMRRLPLPNAAAAVESQRRRQARLVALARTYKEDAA